MGEIIKFWWRSGSPSG